MYNNYKEWDFEEFITFIMYHVAMADYNVAPEEKMLIIKRVSEEKFNEIKHFHSNNSDYDNIQVILFFKDKFCKDNDAINRVYEAANTIFLADGEFNFFERNMKHALQMLLED